MAKKRRRTARDVLTELRWREGKDIKRAEIWYSDRVRAEGYRVIGGQEVTELGRGYFSTGDSMLPYYKILRIVVGDQVLFQRRENKSKTTK